jgi:hypothetical protein
MALGYASLGGKKLPADFEGGLLTSEAGALWLREVDRRTGLIDRVVGARREWRDPRYVLHGLGDLVRQRVFQIARGDEDANDAEALRRDPCRNYRPKPGTPLLPPQRPPPRPSMTPTLTLGLDACIDRARYLMTECYRLQLGKRRNPRATDARAAFPT